MMKKYLVKIRNNMYVENVIVEWKNGNVSTQVVISAKKTYFDIKQLRGIVENLSLAMDDSTYIDGFEVLKKGEIE